jgi:hypothetical protein
VFLLIDSRRERLNFHYANIYEEESLRLGAELAKALDGWTRHSENTEEIKQLRIQLSRWLKKRKPTK